MIYILQAGWGDELGDFVNSPSVFEFYERSHHTGYLLFTVYRVSVL